MKFPNIIDKFPFKLGVVTYGTIFYKMNCGQVISDEANIFSTVAFIEGPCINDNYKKKILSCTRKIMILFGHIWVILQ